MRTIAWSIVLPLVLLAGCERGPGSGGAPIAHAKLDYPATRTVDRTDDYHGTSVADPYRWLEDLDAPEVKAWVDAQNAVAEPYLAAIPRRKEIIDRLTALWNYERYTVPIEEGGKYFFRRNDGLQNQDVLYVMDAWGAEPRVLIDPNAFSKDGTVALSSVTPSPDGKLVAYSVSDGGSDWKTWRVRDAATGEDLEDELRYTKFTDVSWSRDSKGFYYSRYPLGPGPEYAADDQKPVAIWHHRLGTSQIDDRKVYDLAHATRNPYGYVTEDGKYLVVTIFDGYDRNAVHVLTLDTLTPTPRKLFDEWDALYQFIGNDGPVLYFHTTKEAPLARVVAVDLAGKAAKPALREIVPQAAEALDSASYVGGRVVASYLKDAKSLIKVFDKAGKAEREVSLPGLGTAAGFGGHPDSGETFYSYTDFTTPTAVYRYDVASGESTLFRRSEVQAELGDIETRQVFYTSKDGTKVPMFIVHRKGLELDGDNPTLLYGYGGFAVSNTPRYSTSRAVWLEMGGVYALANLRGGGEYGESWHLAGTKLTKQNVFDDFIAAAEYLVAQKYTRPEKLAIQGGSNGGLLVGAVLNQRPELFGAALPAVGVMDMLRYHTASQNARQWSSDYGLSENPQEFKALRAYSPYHNLKAGTCYPPTLVTTADHDDRVVPWHSYKYAAALQAAQGCDAPALIRVETRAGHGAGKPTWMQIENVADQWAFLVRALRV
jgi:prolyl oligopeptidase